jgi:hypothetical protein
MRRYVVDPLPGSSPTFCRTQREPNVTCKSGPSVRVRSSASPFARRRELRGGRGPTLSPDPPAAVVAAVGTTQGGTRRTFDVRSAAICGRFRDAAASSGTNAFRPRIGRSQVRVLPSAPREVVPRMVAVRAQQRRGFLLQPYCNRGVTGRYAADAHNRGSAVYRPN